MGTNYRKELMSNMNASVAKLGEEDLRLLTVIALVIAADDNELSRMETALGCEQHQNKLDQWLAGGAERSCRATQVGGLCYCELIDSSVGLRKLVEGVTRDIALFDALDQLGKS